MTLAEYFATCERVARDNLSWRWGQTLFNVLYQVRPDLSERVRGTFGLDPFHARDNDDPRIQSFLAFITSEWDV